MHLKTVTVGDLHADLWAGLTVSHRFIDGPEDVTVGSHAELGMCVVSHWGGEDRIEWFTQRPVPAAMETAISMEL